MKFRDIVKFIQEKIGKVQKENKVAFGSTKYKYFNLEQLMDKLQPLLDEKDLVIVQPMIVRDGQTILRTELWGDDLISVSEMILPTGVKPQELGSAITYYRRYSIVSLFGLQTEEDDDGNKASGNKAKINYKGDKELGF